MFVNILQRWRAIGGQKMGSKKLSFLFCITFFFFFFVNKSAQADSHELTTTNMYYTLKNINDLSYSFWQGYVEGVAETSPIYCPPAGNTVGQNVQIVVNWLGSHPKVWIMPPSIAASLALNDAYPCKNK